MRHVASPTSSVAQLLLEYQFVAMLSGRCRTYSWSETETEVEVSVPVPTGTRRNQLSITLHDEASGANLWRAEDGPLAALVPRKLVVVVTPRPSEVFVSGEWLEIGGERHQRCKREHMRGWLCVARGRADRRREARPRAR